MQLTHERATCGRALVRTPFGPEPSVGKRSDVRWQRADVRCDALAANDEFAGPPVDIVESQRVYLTSSQPDRASNIDIAKSHRPLQLTFMLNTVATDVIEQTGGLTEAEIQRPRERQRTGG
jgi:hypothetical protein